MREAFQRRTAALQRRLADAKPDAAPITDPDSIYYLSGVFGYLGIEFGRPTLLAVPRAAAPTLVMPLMEQEMGRAMTWIDDVRPWEDGPRGIRPLRRCGAPVNHDPSNHFQIHHQCDHTKGEQGLV